MELKEIGKIKVEGENMFFQLDRLKDLIQ